MRERQTERSVKMMLYRCVGLPGRVVGVAPVAVHGDHQHVSHVFEAGLVGVITFTERHVTVSASDSHAI